MGKHNFATAMRGQKIKALTGVVACHNCGSKMEVTDSRIIYGTVRRRRRCPNCGCANTTYEISAEHFNKLIGQPHYNKR